jgi:hypothetical protein
MHRCARIVFSLSFHLGKMTPRECIDYLVRRVGHERDNATAEVRRSFAGRDAPPSLGLERNNNPPGGARPDGM